MVCQIAAPTRHASYLGWAGLRRAGLGCTHAWDSQHAWYLGVIVLAVRQSTEPAAERMQSTTGLVALNTMHSLGSRLGWGSRCAHPPVPQDPVFVYQKETQNRFLRIPQKNPPRTRKPRPSEAPGPPEIENKNKEKKTKREGRGTPPRRERKEIQMLKRNGENCRALKMRMTRSCSTTPIPVNQSKCSENPSTSPGSQFPDNIAIPIPRPAQERRAALRPELGARSKHHIYLDWAGHPSQGARKIVSGQGRAGLGRSPGSGGAECVMSWLG